MPVARRRPNQATGFTKIGCISTAMAASPVKKAKVRTWPIRRTSGGARKVPTKNPAKYPDITRPRVRSSNPSMPPRTASRVPSRPLPASRRATPASKAASGRTTRIIVTPGTSKSEIVTY